MFVEAHTVGQDDWTTLPDANGHTSQSTGPNDPNLASCPAGWRDLHPFLDHYQTLNGATARARRPARPAPGTPPAGRSGGWEQWSIDLGAYAGKQVEVSIAYASDWATQGLGVFVDDITLPDRRDRRRSRPASAAGRSPARRRAARRTRTTSRATTAAGFPEGAVVATPDTLYMGFGLEGISTPAARNEVMRRSWSTSCADAGSSEGGPPSGPSLGIAAACGAAAQVLLDIGHSSFCGM